MVNLSADRAIAKAKTHAKDGDIATARALLNAVQKAAPNNKLAKKLLSELPPEASVVQTSEPPEETRKQLLELYNQGELVEAVNLADEVLKEFPKSFLVWNICGAANFALGNLTLAHDSFEKVTQLNPIYPDGFNNLGTILKDQGNLKDAISSYQKAISLKPDYAKAHAHMIHQKAHVCDWSKTSDDMEKESLLGIETDAIAPFTMLPVEDAAEKHRLRSEHYAKSKYPQKRKHIKAVPKAKSERMKIGYFSADFHDHATMFLMSQVFALHDKDKFEVHVFSYGANKNDAMRKKLIENVEVFHDVRELSNPQIVEKARALKLDLAIDLKGYTRDTRLAAFAEGIAPVQMSFLGYPGTLGASFIDYIVADPIAIPKELQKHYSEQIMYLPNTYQPTDNTRHISDPRPSRQSVGLPETGFVFACFNNNYKISSREFDIWMRLLTKVEGSVLWLLRSNKWAEQNLKKEAEARSVSAERLIFAEKLPQADHLARQALADLFLDTFNVNAHTTTSDALWAGLPVLTKIGQGFAARVAGSLLAANGLSELITETEEEYEALALDLATNPNKMTALKSKLTANNKTHPLFDSELFTRHLEQGYEMAIQNHLEGNAPKTFYIPSKNQDITDAKPRSKPQPQTRPPARVAPSNQSSTDTSKSKQYFTITSGRSGSAWLASFLSSNLNIEAVHEPLGIEDFGEKMPDIRTMRTFNSHGNNGFVQAFWDRKFSHLPSHHYAETNHTLSKCGLVENLIRKDMQTDTTIIVLKRDIIKQCVSYLVRNDFGNITLAWQWYLHPSYAKKIIPPEPFMKMGGIGIPLWYCYEMLARQEYYVQKFANEISMHEVYLDDLVTKSGAKKLRAALGLQGKCKLPKPKNENKTKPSEQLVQHVTETVGKINVDIPQLVETCIKRGFSFDEVV